MTKRHRQLLADRASLDAKRDQLTKEGHALGDTAEAERRSLTDGERKRRDEILGELDDLGSQLDALGHDISAEQRLEDHEKAAIVRTGAAPDSGGALPARLSSQHEFSGLGEFLQAIACRTSDIIAGGFGRRAEVLGAKLQAYQAAASGMSSGVPADGGYLVRKDWTTAMLDRARDQAVLLPRTRNIPISGDADGLEYPFIDETSRATGSRWGGVQVFRKAEAATVAAKQPKLGKGELRLEEIMGLAYATERLLRDAAALEGLLTGAFESEFAFTIDNEIVRGTGAAQCQGFLTSPAFVTQAIEAGQLANTVVKENILKMYARMPARLKPGAVWLIHPDVMTQLPVMAIGQQPVWIPPGGLASAPLGTLLGRPVVEIEQAEALSTLGDIMLVNLNEYVTITKAGEGLRSDQSMHVRFLYDEMAFRWVYRINGQPIWKTALTPFKGTNTLSPFIGLANRP
jgi:HK97 family phage major capsid protein